MNSQSNSGKEWLQQLLELMGMATEVETEGFETVNADNSCWLNIDSSSLSSEQKQQLIGNKGESIDAIQYLANTILNISQDSEAQNSFVIESDGYRVRRNRELDELTRDAIARVRETGREVEIPGLSSAERKQVHFLLQEIDDLSTESRGHEPDRRLVVLPQ